MADYFAMIPNWLLGGVGVGVGAGGGSDCYDLHRKSGINRVNYATTLNADKVHPPATHYKQRYVRTVSRFLESL